MATTLQGTAVKLADVEPWPEPVNGAEILDAIAKRFDHYAVLPEGAADMLALWCAHTHVFKLFQKSPRLYISAPTEECGKSTLLNCASLFCARAKRTDNMTTAVMFRLVAGHSPTILADECDKWLFTNGELVGLVQSGTEKGGTVMRCEGDSNDLREFGCYAPFALAAIGKLPSQLHSRSIRHSAFTRQDEGNKEVRPFSISSMSNMKRSLIENWRVGFSTTASASPRAIQSCRSIFLIASLTTGGRCSRSPKSLVAIGLAGARMHWSN